MAKESLSIGPNPAAEDCVQLGVENYEVLAKKECQAFINQLRRVYGEEPYGARLKIEANVHSDWGTYYEVACIYDDENKEAEDYALECEFLPEYWDEAAKIELGL